VRWTAGFLSAAVPLGSTYRFDVQPDLTVFVFTFLIAGTAGIAIGVVPALAAIRTDIRSILASAHAVTTDRRRTRMRARIVIGQFAIVTVLLVTAGLFTGSANVGKEAEVGFATSDRLLIRLSPGDNGYDEPRGRQIVDDILTRAASLPGVGAATSVHDVPLGASSASFEVRAQDQPLDAAPRRVSYNVVGPNYFATMEIPIVRGRHFDVPGALAGNPVIVNETLAGSYWPGEDAIGKRLTVAREGDNVRRYEVIGVARNAKYNSIVEAPRGYIYLPYAQHYRSEMTLVLHTAPNAVAVVDAARAIVRQVDPTLALNDITTLEASIDTNALGSVRFGAGLLGIFGALGTALAVLGMFGLLSYTTQLQKRDIGIRMALGATHAEVMRHLLGRSVRLAGKGVAGGLVVSVIVATLVRRSIFGIGSLELAPFVIIPAMLAGVALIAGYLPARRIVSGDPIKALGHE
jgi:putative ABC transport system permease protein